jgi:hypothetical protein
LHLTDVPDKDLTVKTVFASFCILSPTFTEFATQNSPFAPVTPSLIAPTALPGIKMNQQP